MRTEAQIATEIQAELAAWAEYYKQNPSGNDGSGGFYCGTKLNLLYAELGTVMGIDPEEAEKLVKGRLQSGRDGIYEFEKGEFCEGYPWRIILGAETETNTLKPPCPHCKNRIEKKHQTHPMDETREEFKKYETVWAWFIPHAVLAYNEGACNSTLVCLDCILDGMKQIQNGTAKKVKE